MSPGRGSQIYVRPETKKLLWLISRARGLGESGDEVGDTLLLEAIIAKYPELAQYLDKVEELEQEMILVIRK